MTYEVKRDASNTLWTTRMDKRVSSCGDVAEHFMMVASLTLLISVWATKEEGEEEQQDL